MKEKEKVKLISDLLGGFEPTSKCRVCGEEHTGLVMHQRFLKDDIVYDCLFCARGENKTRIDGHYIERGMDRRYAEAAHEMYIHLLKKNHHGMTMRLLRDATVAECMTCQHKIVRR